GGGGWREGRGEAAGGAGAAAVRELARHLRPVEADEVEQLALADVEAVTDLRIELHEHLGTGLRRRRAAPSIVPHLVRRVIPAQTPKPTACENVGRVLWAM